MMTGYKKIFWGIFIATFNIKIGIITILPSFIGWIVVLTGLSELKENSPEADFSKPRSGAMILLAATVGGGLLSLLGSSDFKNFLPLLFYPLVVMTIELVVFHKILEVSVYNFNEMNRQEEVDKYTENDRTYIILMGITMVLLAISLTINNQTIGFVGASMAVISRIYLLTAINSLSKAEKMPEETNTSY